MAAKKVYSFFIPLLIQVILLYAMSCFNTIQWCSLFFSLLTLHLFYLAHENGLKTTFLIHTCSVVCVFLLNINETYYIHGKPIAGLFTASYLSVFFCLSAGLFIFEKTKDKGNDYLRYGLCTFFSSVTDGLFMMVFFLPVYQINRVLDIFFREVGWKTLYMTFILTTVFFVKKEMVKRKKLISKTSNK